MHRIHFLPIGNHTDGVGTEESYTMDDLLEIKNSYSPDIFEAPIVLGHTEDLNAIYRNDQAPAYGWVKKLGVDNNGLYADAELNPAFSDLLEEEVAPYKYISAGIYNKENAHSPTKGQARYLRHIAFLGAMPPAIKGLPNVAKMYGEVVDTNPDKLFNLCRIIKINNNNMSTKRYAEEGVITMPGADASDEDVKSFLEENAIDFFKYIIGTGENGFPNEIVEIVPTPSLENKYLITGKDEFSGKFIDELDDEYEFSIDKSGDVWSTTYAPVNKEESGGAEAETFSEELSINPEEEELLEKGEIAINVPMEEEVIEELSEVEPVAGDVDELTKLKEEVALLRKAIEEKDLDEYETYSEKYADVLKEIGVAPRELARILLNNRATTMTYGEGKTSSSTEVITKLLDGIYNRKEAAAMVTYGELAPEEPEELDIDDEDTYAPVGTVYSEESDVLHKKVVSYCKRNDLNPRNTKDYASAYEAVISKTV